jgi:hypothetical protein
MTKNDRGTVNMPSTASQILLVLAVNDHGYSFPLSLIKERGENGC